MITGDIPLASEVIDNGGKALNPRGEMYSTENIKMSLAMRDLMGSLRSSGVETGGQSAFSQTERNAFANNLDKWLVQNTK